MIYCPYMYELPNNAETPSELGTVSVAYGQVPAMIFVHRRCTLISYHLQTVHILDHCDLCRRVAVHEDNLLPGKQYKQSITLLRTYGVRC